MWIDILNMLGTVIPVVLIAGAIIAGVYFRVIKKVPFEKGNIPNVGYFDDLPDSVIPRAPKIEVTEDDNGK